MQANRSQQWRSAFGIIFLFVLLIVARVDASDSFFTPAVDRGSGLPVDKVFPQGRLFPYGGFSGVASREAANMFTLHGPAYGAANKALISEAQATGLHAVYTIGILMNFLRNNGQPKLDLSVEEIAAEIRRQVEAVVDNEAIAWWYLTPEELRPWQADEMEYLEVAARTIRETDPLKRPIWMYDPGHRAADHLAVTAQYLDIVGKGMYTNYSGQKGYRVWARWTIEQQIAAIKRSGRPGAIQIAVPEMFREPGPGELGDVPSWVRHDVYAALVAGAQGVVTFSLANRAGFTPQAWKAYYDSYAQIARELNGELGLGQVFLFGERRNDLRLSIIEGEKVVSPKVGSGGITEVIHYPSVSMANIAYGNERYVFLVNSSESPVTVRLDGLPDEPVNTYDAYTSATLPPITSTVTVSLAPLGAAGLRLSQGVTAPPSAAVDSQTQVSTQGESLHLVKDISGQRLSQAYVWMASPQPGQMITFPTTPITIEAPGIELRSVEIKLDGKRLYQGVGLPTSLSLQTAELPVGEHHMAITTIDETGKARERSFDFTVKHFQLEIPGMKAGGSIQGKATMRFEWIIAPDELKEVSIDLAPIVDGERREAHRLHTGTVPLPTLDLDTRDFPDGAYDLDIRATTQAGITTELTQRIVFANWAILEDSILPPSGGWFGSIDQLKTFQRSTGWEFVSATAGLSADDNDRIRRSSEVEEYLTWRLPRLQRFSFILYARLSHVENQVKIAISPDASNWYGVPYTTQVLGQLENGWVKLAVHGTVPAEAEGEYLRFTVSGSNTDNSTVELGHVQLVGVK